MVVDSLHDFVVLAWLLIQFNAKIEENELKDVLFVFTTAIFQLVLQIVELFLLTIFRREERLTDLSVYQRNFLIRVLFLQGSFYLFIINIVLDSFIGLLVLFHTVMFSLHAQQSLLDLLHFLRPVFFLDLSVC